MKPSHLLAGIFIVLMAACAAAGSERVLSADLPDPAIYALSPSELPEIGVDWQQSYNQTSVEQGYKWSYQAYQAYQPGSTANELDSAYAVNNDIYLYETDMRRSDLPQPPASLGKISNVTWKPASQLHRVGDKSAVWKTTVGDLFTPVWWLEFYKGHAYVRLSLFGFPDQIAPAIIYGLADIVAERLPASPAELRSDAATQAAPLPAGISTTIPPISSPTAPAPAEIPTGETIPVLSYTAPPGQTGMVSFADETGSQLSDGKLGSDDLLADLGKGAAYEWVGWTEQTEPVTITFTLPAGANVAAVEIGVNHRDGLGVFVPGKVTINGVSFDLTADAVPNNQRKDLLFTGPFSGDVITIVLNHRSRGWIMLDEVRFLSNQ